MRRLKSLHKNKGQDSKVSVSYMLTESVNSVAELVLYVCMSVVHYNGCLCCVTLYEKS